MEIYGDVTSGFYCQFKNQSLNHFTCRNQGCIFFKKIFKTWRLAGISPSRSASRDEIYLAFHISYMECGDIDKPCYVTAHGKDPYSDLHPWSNELNLKTNDSYHYCPVWFDSVHCGNWLQTGSELFTTETCLPGIEGT